MPESVSPIQAAGTAMTNIRLTPEKPSKTASDWVRDMRMSPTVNKTTTGVETAQVTGDLMLATSKRLLGISRGDQEPDPKDSLEFQRFYGPAEYFAEHVLRDGNKLGRNILWKATNVGNLDFMPVNALDKHINDVYYDSKLAQMVDGSSPLETVDASYKTTRIGEGGVGDLESAPDEMRTVQPSFLGFVDPIRSPESFRVGLDVYMTKNVMKGSDGKLYQKFINAHTGKEELVDSETIAKSVVTTPEMMQAKTKSVFALGGPTGVRIVPRKSIDYYLPRADEAYSISSNLVTMPSAVIGMRLLMGCLYPETNVFVADDHNMITMKPAKLLVADKQRIPGMNSDYTTACFPMRNTVAKMVPQPKWFKKIVTKSGRVLVTSYDHKWPVVINNKITLVQARDLKPGDTVLRTAFHDVPNRRTFINKHIVTKDVAFLLGLLCRSAYSNKKGSVTIRYKCGADVRIRDAVKYVWGDQKPVIRQYKKEGFFCMTIRCQAIWDFVNEHIGFVDVNRDIPSEILSAYAEIVAEFLNGYTCDDTMMGTDSNEDIWVLFIPNMRVRDELAFLFARIGTDTLYRDAAQNGELQIALKISAESKLFHDMYLDTVKYVWEGPKCPIMVDIDIDDNMYAVANGIVTHNSKYPLQAISLDNREAPLVRTLDEATGKDMSTLVGKFLGARFAPQGGMVTAVRKDRIDVLWDDGTKGAVPLYVNFPMNAKGFINNTPVVKAGQPFKRGQILASSNYTDKDGTAALGTNLKSGWISWKGGTYEDAVVISEEAAKKLTSTTMYNTSVDLDKTISLGKKNYITWKPAEYTKEQMDNLDDNGIVRPNTVLHKGDPMILAIRTSEPSPGTMGKRILTDLSETWDHDHPGIVTDVVRTRKGVKVFTTVTAPAEVGDKIAGLHGNKGTIAQILPKEQMPQTKNGTPLDICFSPLGVTSRNNTAQLYEALLGKVAKKTGKIQTLPAFFEGDLHDYVEGKLKEAHVHADDDLVDPETGREIPGILTGFTYVHKLKHLAESKMSARGTGEYSADETPAGKGMTGCYPGIQRIMTIHGMKRISEICERRQPEYVLTWDGKQYCYKQVTDWFVYRSAVSDILNIKTKYNISTTGNDHHSLRHTTSIYPTKNHHMYLADMTIVEAGQLKVGDKLAGIGPVMTEAQKSVIIGTLLGDACRSRGDCVSCEHSSRQMNYVNWKYDMLKGIGARLFSGTYKTTESKRSDGKTIVSAHAKMLHIPKSAALEELVATVYDGTEKRHITKQALSMLGELGFCVWFLDDGSIHNRSHNKGKDCPEGTISTQGFSSEDTLLAVEWLKTFLNEPDGIATSEITAKDGSKSLYIRLLRSASWKVANIVARNVPHGAIPASKSWLKRYAEKVQEEQLVYMHDCASTLGIVPVEIIDIQPYKPDKQVSEMPVYDFTVADTHKYILSGGVICSNSKRFGMLEQGAMVGHGAFQNMLDAKVIRGQSNADFWRSIRTGSIPVMPGEPLVHKKFFAHLIGSGVNIRKTQKGVSAFALSSDDVNELAGPRELKTRDTYEAKNFRPIDGGLFGQDVFGINGDKWGYIKLDEPVPNPVMEEPLARLLRMPDKTFVGVATGKIEYNGIRGPLQLRDALANIDLNKEAKNALVELKNAPVSKKDAALKRYVAIERMRRAGVSPDKYMLDKIPVLPPQFRPITSHNGLTMVADSNYLYAQLLDARDDVKEARDLPEEFQQQARETLYKNWKELTGLYEPENKAFKAKHIQGLLKWALGDSPKFSAAQRKVISATVDTVGRGAITPNPRLKLNEVGIPEDMAFGIFSPLIERGLVQRGYTPVEAIKQVHDKSRQAHDILLDVMKTHPVLMNRAPTLHKLSIMAFNPVPVTGHAIQINPSIVVPFNADFDGDTVNIHAPMSDNAREEARRKMFPERNLIAMKNRQIAYKPEKEYLQGLYTASHINDKSTIRPVLVKDLAEAREAYRQGRINIDDPIDMQNI